MKKHSQIISPIKLVALAKEGITRRKHLHHQINKNNKKAKREKRSAMASSASWTFLLCICLLPFSSLAAPSPAKGAVPVPAPVVGDGTTLKQLCSKTQNPTLCVEVTAAVGEDKSINALGLKLIRSVNATIIENHDKTIPAIIAATPAGPAKAAYELCLQHYYNAREDLKDSERLLSRETKLATRAFGVMAKNAELELLACRLDLGDYLKNSLVVTSTKLGVFTDAIAAVAEFYKPAADV